MLDARTIIATVQLIFFLPSAILCTALCIRHGFDRTAGWIYILLLALTRCAAAVCQLIYKNQPSVQLAITIGVLDSVIISPLLLSLLGILAR